MDSTSPAQAASPVSHESEMRPNTEEAQALLKWAADVGQGEAELEREIVRPTPAAYRALDAEEVRSHLDRLLVGKNTEDGLEALYRSGALDVWLPEVASMVGFGDGEWRHKDVWKHTKQVVWQSVPRLEVRWGALLHDIGKPRTRKIHPNGEVTFHGHAELGASMFRRKVAKRLGFTGPLYDRVHFLILHHLRASAYDGTWTDSAVRRFAKEMGDGLKDLLDLSRADITTKRPHKRKRGLREISELASRVREIEKVDARVPPLPKGLGTALTTDLGIPPSKKLGIIRDRLEAMCDAGELEGQQDVSFYVAYVRDHAADFDL